MASLRARRRTTGTDYWPGFVDAMATLLLVIIFLLSIFMLAQFFLSQQLSGRDTVLNRLNAQISELTELLALERSNKSELEDTITGLRASLGDANSERERLQGLLDSSAGDAQAAGGRASKLENLLDEEKQTSQRALAPECRDLLVQKLDLRLGADRASEPADLGTPAPARRRERGPRRSRSQGN